VFRGWIGYNGGRVLTADARGLYVSAMPIVLAPWHPPQGARLCDRRPPHIFGT